MTPPLTEEGRPGACCGAPSARAAERPRRLFALGSAPWGLGRWGPAPFNAGHKHQCPCAPTCQRDMVFRACCNANIFWWGWQISYTLMRKSCWWMRVAFLLDSLSNLTHIYTNIKYYDAGQLITKSGNQLELQNCRGYWLHFLERLYIFRDSIVKQKLKQH